LHAHSGLLPDDVHGTFANTGTEREETLRFVHECQGSLGSAKFIGLSNQIGTQKAIEDRLVAIAHNSASRNGEPFRAGIAAQDTDLSE
jgi:hypothetical protein